MNKYTYRRASIFEYNLNRNSPPKAGIDILELSQLQQRRSSALFKTCWLE
jgi:hypothetical protein